MSSNNFAERAIRIIRKNPGVFEALLEFERTKKLPKTIYRERVDVTIAGDLLREFRRYCKENAFSMSRVLEKHIKEELKKEKN